MGRHWAQGVKESVGMEELPPQLLKKGKPGAHHQRDTEPNLSARESQVFGGRGPKAGARPVLAVLNRS